MDYETADTGSENVDIEDAESENGKDPGDEAPEEGETPAQRRAREEQEAKERELRARKRRLIPPFVMLLAGAITSITMRVLHSQLMQLTS